MAIALTHPLKKSALLLFHTILGSVGNALLGKCRIHIQVEGQIRLKVAVNPMLEHLELFQIKLATKSLIGKGCIGEAVADHPLPSPQGRPNDLLQVLTSGSKDQQQLG